MAALYFLSPPQDADSSPGRCTMRARKPIRFILLGLTVATLAGALAFFGVLREFRTTRALMPLPIQPFAADAQGGISTNKLGQNITANWTVTQALQGERTTIPWEFSGPGFSLDLDKEIKNPVDDDGDTVVNDGCPKVGANAETGAQCLNAVDDADGDPVLDGVVNDGCPVVGPKAEGPGGGSP
jgi:hypothetical protein